MYNLYKYARCVSVFSLLAMTMAIQRQHLGYVSSERQDNSVSSPRLHTLQHGLLYSEYASGHRDSNTNVYTCKSIFFYFIKLTNLAFSSDPNMSLYGSILWEMCWFLDAQIGQYVFSKYRFGVHVGSHKSTVTR